MLVLRRRILYRANGSRGHFLGKMEGSLFFDDDTTYEREGRVRFEPREKRETDTYLRE